MVVLVIVAIFAAFGLFMWEGTPTNQPTEHVEGKVVTIWSTPGGKTRPSRLMMDVELPDHRQDSVPVPDTIARECKVGDRVRLTGAHTRGGWLWVSVDPGSCR